MRNAIPKFLAIVVVMIVLAFIPIRTLKCPSWDVWVIDRSGRPVPGITVRLSYRNYSAETQFHESDAITDEQGHVNFSRQTLTVLLARRAIVILSSAMGGVHASFGSHASVFAFGDGLRGYDVDKQKDVIVDWTGIPDRMESRIVVMPQSR